MKTNQKLFAVTLAAGAAGVALFALAQSAFVAALPGDVLLGVTASLGLLVVAAYDYSRRYRPLALPHRLLRPALPAAPRTVAAFSRHHRAA